MAYPAHLLISDLTLDRLLFVGRHSGTMQIVCGHHIPRIFKTLKLRSDRLMPDNHVG